MRMNTTTQIPDPGIPENAVSVYGQDSALDDFPVLKAFQQYIDSEQAKARKRMLMLCTFFAFLMIVVMAVFVALLVSVSSRNQSLNDRLVEFAMKERDRPSTSPVVVQPTQDNSALLSLSAKLDDMQRKLAEAQSRAEKAAAASAAAEAAAAARTKDEQSKEKKEIERLKSLLAAEKEKAAQEKEKKRQAEVEAYRRQLYPEFYATADVANDEADEADVERNTTPRRRPAPTRARTAQPSARPTARKPAKRTSATVDDVEALLEEVDAIRYFDDEKETSAAETPKAEAKALPTKDAPEARPQATLRPAVPPSAASTPQKTAPAPAAPAKSAAKPQTIPVDVKGSSGSWSIPLD